MAAAGVTPGFSRPGDGEEVALHRAVRIDLERQPEIGWPGLRLDGLGVERAEHADDVVRLAVQRQRAADDGAVAAEAPFPEALAQDDDAAAIRQVFVRGEGAAGDDGCAEQAEELGADMGGRDLLGVALGEVDDAEAIRRDVLERARSAGARC